MIRQIVQALGFVPRASLEAVQTEMRVQLARAQSSADVMKKNYIGAQLSRHMQFMNALQSADYEIKKDFRRLRAHSRDLAKNNPFMRRYVSLVSTNVIGPKGIGFESGIRGNKNKPKESWNDQIEEAWAAWCECCTVDGLMSWIEAQILIAETTATDGECLVRLVRGFPNDFGFALEFIDVDRLDHNFNQAAVGNQNRVVMGVEVDGWNRPLAYWIWTAHPTDTGIRKERIRIPANQIVHVFRPDRVSQTRGVPWSHPVMWMLNMLGRYWESELVAANNEADRLGFLEAEFGEFNGDVTDPTTIDIQSEMGSFIGLPPGVAANIPNLQHPNTAFPEFSKALQRGLAAGWNVAYHSLSADVSAANFSSARVALLDERDGWRKLQRWFISRVCNPIFRAWLEMAVAKGIVSIPSLSFAKMCKPVWYPRGWAWVDPEKDIKASLLAIGGGLSTIQRELGEQGEDWRETLDQAALEQGYAKDKGLELTFGLSPKPAAPNATDDPAAPGPKETPKDGGEDGSES